MAEKPMRELQANVCGLCLCVSSLNAKNWILTIITRVNDRKTQIGCGLPKGIRVALLGGCGQFIIEIKNFMLMDKIKRVLVSCAKTKECLGVVVLQLELRKPLGKLCECAALCHA